MSNPKFVSGIEVPENVFEAMGTVQNWGSLEKKRQEADNLAIIIDGTGGAGKVEIIVENPKVAPAESEKEKDADGSAEPKKPAGFVTRLFGSVKDAASAVVSGAAGVVLETATAALNKAEAETEGALLELDKKTEELAAIGENASAKVRTAAEKAVADAKAKHDTAKDAQNKAADEYQVAGGKLGG